MMASKRPGQTSGTFILTALSGLLLALLLFITGCRSLETVHPMPSKASPDPSSAVVMPQKNQPPPQKKVNPPEDIAPSPTPAKLPASSPTPLPAVAAAGPTPIVIEQDDALRSPALLVEETATAVPLVECKERFPGDDLFTIVTLDYGLSPDFVPADLVSLADHVPYNVTLGYPTEVREVILDSLVHMIDDMLSAGLHPQILSGYRSYIAQVIARDKWETLYPDHVSIISAPPGYSEHQLGTVVDFGSPELPGIVGQPDIQFHTYFYKTSEGQWLAENADKYGFTLSYPAEAFETTGFYYEPWHYRFVGQSLARQLREQETTLIEFQLANQQPPCLP